jgi:hypothetical protein
LPQVRLVRGGEGEGVPGDSSVEYGVAGCEGGGCGGGECPFVNLEDPRCAAHLTLNDMGYAFDHCFDNFGRCEVYGVIARECAGRDEAQEGESTDGAREPVVEVTVGTGVRESGWRRWRIRIAALTLGRRRSACGGKPVQQQRRAG